MRQQRLNRGQGERAGFLLALLVGAGVVGEADAATISLNSDDGSLFVVVDGGQQHEAPVTLDDIEAGTHTLAFKATAFGAVLFEEEVEVGDEATLQIMVDLDAREVGLVQQELTAIAETPAVAAPPTAEEAGVEGSEPTEDAHPPSPPEEPPPPAGDLYVEADVEGARIIVDGEDSGELTNAMLTGLPVGLHEVTLVTECGRARGDVEIREGLIQRLELVMRTGPGSLSITTVPEGATVFLDGEEIGSAPRVLKDIACGSHELAFRAPGYLEAEVEVRTPAFQVTTVVQELVEETYGTLVIAPTPLTATVLVDGVPAGHGPMSIEGVGTGHHRLELAADGYEPWEQQVEILADEITRLDVALTPLEVRSGPDLPLGRLGLDAGVTAGGLGLGIASVASYVKARDRFDLYMEITSDEEAVEFYNESILPLKRAALAEAIGGGVLLVAGGWLFATTDWSVTATSQGVAINGRW